MLGFTAPTKLNEIIMLIVCEVFRHVPNNYPCARVLTIQLSKFTYARCRFSTISFLSIECLLQLFKCTTRLN